jgi:hypothetical protein
MTMAANNPPRASTRRLSSNHRQLWIFGVIIVILLIARNLRTSLREFHSGDYTYTPSLTRTTTTKEVFHRVGQFGLYLAPASFSENAVAVEELEERADLVRATSNDLGQLPLEAAHAPVSVVEIKINDTPVVDAPASVVNIKINVEISETLAAFNSTQSSIPELSLEALSGSRTAARVFPEGPGSIGWNPLRDSGQDVLMTFREFNCQTKASILSVLKFVRPTPAMIHVVIKEDSHCPALEKLAPGKVTCYRESTVLPGVNYESLANAFKVKGAKNETVSWYFQQFIKLGFALFNDISPNFLVWDADNILIRLYSPVDENGRVRVLYGGNNPGTKTTNYVWGYKEMVNATMVKSPDRSSYVVHQALFNKNFVYELLDRMGGHDCENVSAKICAQEMKWIWRTIDVFKGEKHLSEYAYYISYVMSFHKEQPMFFSGNGKQGDVKKGNRGKGGRSFCRSPLLASANMCPLVYENVTGFETELKNPNLFYVVFDTHESENKVKGVTTGEGIAESISLKEDHHYRSQTKFIRKEAQRCKV